MDNENKLTKYIQSEIPEFFDKLSSEEKSKALTRIFDKNLELQKFMGEKAIKSTIAKGDLDTLLNTIEQLDANRKVYSVSSTSDTGSGKISVQVKGGDTKFIVPIIIAVGLIILGLIYLLTR